MTDRSSLAALADRLTDARVLCVGDVMLDRFVYGNVDRISPEAPIPVLHIDREDTMLGGAGNVVRNLVSLGAEVDCISAIGLDGAGFEVRALLANNDRINATLVEVKGRETSIKTRFLAGTQQMLRADQETIGAVDTDTAMRLVDAATTAMAQCGAVVLSDYGKGVLTNTVIEHVIEAARARNLPVVVDPKGRDYSKYKGASVLTPNRKELAQATGMATHSDDDIINACQTLIGTAGVDAILATRSQEGMTLVPSDSDPIHLQAEAHEVFDVSGAGDTVVATLAAALASGAASADASALANVAAGIAVAKVGTAAVYGAELVGALHHQDLTSAEQKVLSLDQAIDRIAIWRHGGSTVGFTNGCFDLLHPGHVSLLTQARAQCDRLVVGLNSDASVKRLKGDSRPVQSEAARSTVLASLSTVDLVIVFGEDTPLNLIHALIPDVLIKGADYTVETVVGADVVQNAGGRVHLADLEAGHSTTNTIQRLNGDG